MTSCVLSSCYEPFHIDHWFLHSTPSVMFFKSWICHHHEGVFLFLVHLHVWWWRSSGMAWVITWISFHAHEEDGCIQLVACIHTSRIFTLMVVQPTEWQHALTWALMWSHWRHFLSFWCIKKLLQQRKASHESPMDFCQRLRDLQFESLKRQMKFVCLWDMFEYCLKKFAHPKKKFKLNPRSVFFSDGVAQSQMDTVTAICDCKSSPHQIAPPP